MSLLRTEPPEAVRSLEELFAIAHGMELESQQRYAALANKVRAEGVPALASLFDWLSNAERAHVEHVDRWSRNRRGKAPDPRDIKWDPPQIFDDETAGELATSQLADAYRVLSMAVRNEERAFALWTYIASRAEDQEVREAAETMAREELEHVAILRRARREAYHEGRSRRAPTSAVSTSEALTRAARLERDLADLLEDKAATREGDIRARLLELAQQARVASPRAAVVTAERESGEQRSIVALAENLVEIYLDVGDRAGDENTTAEAQKLAQQAVARLAWLRGLEDAR